MVRRKVRSRRKLPALEAFVVHLEQAGLSQRTISFYRRDIERFFVWLDSTLPHPWRWDDVTELAIEGFRAHLKRNCALAHSSVNRALHGLRKFCYWASCRGLVAEDPAAAVVTPRPPETAPAEPLTDDQIASLLHAAGRSRHGLGKRNYALIMLFLETGLRGEELVALTMQDVTIRPRSGSITLPVLDSPPLTVPLPASLHRALHRYVATRIDRRPEAPLFTSKRTTPLSLRALQAVIRDVARRAGLRNVSPHRLRHTFAARFLADNPDKIWDLADRMGLLSIHSLQRYLDKDQTS